MINAVDCHTHSKFSPDGSEEPEKMVLSAISKGITHLAITDHMDLNFDSVKYPYIIDLQEYHNTLSNIKEKYKEKIYLCVGLECGYTNLNKFLNKAALEKTKFEYVINSIHEVNGEDCYFEEYFEGRTKQETYDEFFETVLSSLDAPYEFHAVGHLSYISRNSPYKDSLVHYCEHKELLDSILEKIIKKEIILEINTSVCRSTAISLPDFNIVKRYKELGGKFITFSSDAHKIETMLKSYDAVVENAIICGFNEFTVIQNGQKKFIGIK